jgi:high-affinity iron transporter
MPRYLASLLSVVIFLALAGVARAAPPAQTVLHLLDYIAVDYAEAVADDEIKNTDERKEMPISMRRSLIAP